MITTTSIKDSSNYMISTTSVEYSDNYMIITTSVVDSGINNYHFSRRFN
jgi:hypothetical protein